MKKKHEREKGMNREPFIAHSGLTNEIYIVIGKEKYRVTEQAIKAVMAIKALEQESCEDTISRQAAIDVIMGEPTDAHYPSWYAERLEQLPSVQPRNGKWIDYSDEGYLECPFCHNATNCDGDKDELHYCFSCGAELR